MQTFDIKLVDKYEKLLNIKSSFKIHIDPTNFDCNTCDSIFEQVFAFVNQNYIGDNTISYSVPADFDKSNASRVLEVFDKDHIYIHEVKPTDDVLNGLNDVAKSELTNKFNELNKKDDDVSRVDEEVTNNILTRLQEKATNELKNQINTLPKNETA